MKVVVTGGCGFIGSHLVDELQKAGHDVVVIDNLMRGRYIWSSSGPLLKQASILDRDAVRSIVDEYRPDAVYHMAAHHYIPFCESNPYESFATNVIGTLNVLDAATAAGSVRKLFFASTGDVYAPSGYQHGESDPPSPVYVYGETKLICEAMLRRYKSSVKVPFDITIGRIFNAAGPRETNPHLLPEIVRQLDAGSTLIEVGNTWPIRDFVDVRSMANIIRRITEKTTGIDVFNIGSGHAQQVEDALNILVRSSGRNVPVRSVEARKRPNDRPYLCPAVTKLTNALGAAASPFSEDTARAIWQEPAGTRLLYA